MEKITLTSSDVVQSEVFGTTEGGGHPIRTVEEFVASLARSSAQECWTKPVEGKCLLADRGGGWKKGKIRLTLEFEPDEGEIIPPKPPASDLDDIRQQLKDN